jgi:hypothetical protein
MLRMLAAIVIPTMIFLSFQASAEGEGGKVAPPASESGTIQRSELGEPAGRYTLRDAEGGMLRLDRETGTLSFCFDTGKGWRCEAAGDEVAACEQRAAALKARVEEMESRMAALAEQLAAMEEKGESPFTLPDRTDVDRMMTYLEQMMDALANKVRDLTEKDKKGDRI